MHVLNSNYTDYMLLSFNIWKNRLIWIQGTNIKLIGYLLARTILAQSSKFRYHFLQRIPPHPPPPPQPQPPPLLELFLRNPVNFGTIFFNVFLHIRHRHHNHNHPHRTPTSTSTTTTATATPTSTSTTY